MGNALEAGGLVGGDYEDYPGLARLRSLPFPLHEWESNAATGTGSLVCLALVALVVFL